MSGVLVCGSTGNVGSATVRALAEAGVQVKAGCRNIESEKAVALGELDNVELVHVDMGAEATVTEVCCAFVGCEEVQHQRNPQVARQQEPAAQATR